MKIHFIFPSAKPDWHVIKLLRERFLDATFDCGEISGYGRYKHRIQLIARTPWLAYYAFQSMLTKVKQGPLPDYVCVETDVEVIGCLLAQVFTRKKVPIILLGFIYTPRKSWLLRNIRWLIYRSLLSQTAAVICYSKFESHYLPDLFCIKKTLFVPMLYGGKLNVPEGLQIKNVGKPSYLVSAGRSGRDYHLLCEAVKGLPIELHIICDSEHALKGLRPPPNVKILRNCYGHQYIAELAGADMVVLPLKDDNLSSGQMVLLDAMALGKIVIITRTATTIEYGEHLKTCYFVKPDSIEELRTAIDYGYRPDVMESLGPEAKRHYSEHHAIEPVVNSLTNAITTITSEATPQTG